MIDITHQKGKYDEKLNIIKYITLNFSLIFSIKE